MEGMHAHAGEIRDHHRHARLALDLAVLPDDALGGAADHHLRVELEPKFLDDRLSFVRVVRGEEEEDEVCGDVGVAGGVDDSVRCFGGGVGVAEEGGELHCRVPWLGSRGLGVSPEGIIRSLRSNARARCPSHY